MRLFILDILVRIIVSACLAYFIDYLHGFNNRFTMIFNMSLCLFFGTLITVTPNFNNFLGLSYIDKIHNSSVQEFLRQRINKKIIDLEESSLKYMITLASSTLIPVLLDTLLDASEDSYHNVKFISIYTILRVIAAVYSYTFVFSEMMTYRRIIRDATL